MEEPAETLGAQAPRRTVNNPTGAMIRGLFLRAIAPVVLCASAPVRLCAQLPPNPPSSWRPLIGEYGPDTVSGAMVLENGRKLYLRRQGGGSVELVPDGRGRWKYADTLVVFFQAHRRTGARADSMSIGPLVLRRLALGPEEGAVFRITPVAPIDSLRREALAATPPTETGVFRTSDLVELVRLDPTIQLDIRYATTRNFLGVVLYSSPRAFLQRPAAEALVRAHHRLRGLGYGLLIHDGYRPWYVTRMFWDATPPAQHDFVADPSRGSRHNRGAAVDLTLYDRRTGKPVEMPGTYDEFSRRSFPEYPGGTTRQRWLRELLRTTMEAEGFTVFEAEWWHFDYLDWRLYPIGNTVFEDLAHRRTGAQPNPP